MNNLTNFASKRNSHAKDQYSFLRFVLKQRKSLLIAIFSFEKFRNYLKKIKTM